MDGNEEDIMTEEPDKGEELKSETFGETESPHEHDENKEGSEKKLSDGESESREDGFGGFDDPDYTPS